MKSILSISRTTLITACLCLLASPLCSAAPPDLSGSYTCSGKDAVDNSEYTVDMTVTKNGDVYNYKGVETGMNNKTQNYMGTGLFAKNSNSILASEFWQVDNLNKAGVIIYQIQPDGSLEGVWTWRDKNAVGSEICKKK